MRYVLARYERDRAEKMYRIYVTEGFRHLASLDKRYTDLLKKQSIETRTSDEIIEGIRNKLRGGEQ